MLGNLILENCNAPGTGALTLAGAPAGRQTFVGSFGTGVKCFYAVTDGSQTEEGWSVTGASLTRNVIWNTAGTTSPLNFTGSCQVYCPLPAQRALWADDASIYQAQNRRLANLGAATAAGDAVRFDQMAWRRLGPDLTPRNVGAVGFFLTGAIKYRMEWSGLSASGAGTGVLLAQCATDGGQYYDGGQHYWFGVTVRPSGPSGTPGQYSSSTVSTYIPLTNGQTGGQVHEGSIEINPGTGRGLVRNMTGASTVSDIDGFFHYTVAGVNALVVTLNGGAFDGGSVRLLGWAPL